MECVCGRMRGPGDEKDSISHDVVVVGDDHHCQLHHGIELRLHVCHGGGSSMESDGMLFIP